MSVCGVCVRVCVRAHVRVCVYVCVLGKQYQQLAGQRPQHYGQPQRTGLAPPSDLPQGSDRAVPPADQPPSVGGDPAQHGQRVPSDDPPAVVCV